LFVGQSPTNKARITAGFVWLVSSVFLPLRRRLISWLEKAFRLGKGVYTRFPNAKVLQNFILTKFFKQIFIK
jgi:hypothetical protein